MHFRCCRWSTRCRLPTVTVGCCLLFSTYMVLTVMEQSYIMEHLPKPDTQNRHENGRNDSVTSARERKDVANIVSLENRTIHIYSAIARNSSRKAVWDTIGLNGWEHRSLYSETDYTCCLKYNSSTETDDSTILRVPVFQKKHWLYVNRAMFNAKQYACRISSLGRSDLPVGISLVVGTGRCSADSFSYVTPVYPIRAKGISVAVCTKIAYGSLPASSIIEWFELHRAMGVDKVVTYTNQLNQDAMKVLKYYSSKGIGEVLAFDLPDTGGSKRSVGVKNFQGWNDEQVPVLDCQDRLAGFTYTGLIDLDEYVTPKLHKNWKNMLAYLRKKFPRAAGFTFKTEVYVTSWGAVANGSDISFGKFLNRTSPIRDRVKSIIISERAEPGRLSTHGYGALKGFLYRKCLVPPDVATLKHYRPCRKEWLRGGGQKCYKDLQRITDTSMVQLASKVQAEIRRVKTLLDVP